MSVSHPDKRFIDTNVVLYLYSEDEPDKKAAAEAVVRGDERAWISTQVLSEMANVLRRKFKLDYPDIAAAVDDPTVTHQRLHGTDIACLLQDNGGCLLLGNRLLAGLGEHRTNIGKRTTDASPA